MMHLPKKYSLFLVDRTAMTTEVGTPGPKVGGGGTIARQMYSVRSSQLFMSED